MLKGKGIDRIIPSVHHVIIEVWITGRCNLEHFITTGRSDDGIGGGDCWDDVLDDSLSQ